jgi:HSP20 family protein
MASSLTSQKNRGSQLAERREHPLVQLQRQFDTLFDRLWGGWGAVGDREFDSMRMWDFDVREDDQEITVRAELPGFAANELDVQLNGDTLTIKAEKEQKGERMEERRRFFRSIALPSGIDPDKVQAAFRNGVLEMHMPRAEGAKPKRVVIQGDRAASNQAQGSQGLSRQTPAAEAGARGDAQGRQGAPQVETPAPGKAKK